MANSQFIKLDGVLQQVESNTIQTYESNTIIQVDDIYDYAIDPTLVFADPQLNFSIFPVSATTVSAFGTSQLNQIVFAESSVSTVAFGDIKVNEFISDVPFPSIDSTVIFGTSKVNYILYADDITSTAQVGVPRVNESISDVPFPSIDSTATFGNSQLNMKIVDIPTPQIISTVSIPSPNVTPLVKPISIATTANFGISTFIDNIHRLLVFKNDNISKVGENDAVVIAGGIRMNPASLVSENAEAGQAQLPSNPVGFLSINISGVDYKIPYYN